MLPSLPPECAYTRCYCEENIYILCKTFSSQPEILEFWSLYVVFISNENKTVALWSQKAGNPVVWDYHVILVLKSRIQDERSKPTDLYAQAYQESVVYDFDTSQSIPCLREDYFSATFLNGLPPNYQSKFRVIPAEKFLKYFASDRSHMLAKTEVGEGGPLHENAGSFQIEEPRYLSPPPHYPPIRGQGAIDKGINHNLMSHYVDMRRVDDSGACGKVCSYEEVLEFFSVADDIEGRSEFFWTTHENLS